MFVFHRFFTVDAVGRNGKLALMWTNKKDVEVFSYSLHHINAWVEDTKANSNWIITIFYGKAETKLRQKSWHLLKEIQPLDQLPWMVLKDFNEILFHYEKFGDKPKSERLMQNFC